MNLRSRFALLIVLLPALAGCQRHDYLELSPTRLELTRRGEVQAISAKAMDRSGHYYPEVLLQWQSEDPEVATVDPQGQVTATGAGTTWIVATAGKVSARAQVKVILPARVEALDRELTLSLANKQRVVPRVRVLDAAGQPLPDRQVFFRPQDEGVVTVDPQGGLWPAAEGETVIEVAVGDETDEIRVRVTP